MAAALALTVAAAYVGVLAGVHTALATFTALILLHTCALLTCLWWRQPNYLLLGMAPWAYWLAADGVPAATTVLLTLGVGAVMAAVAALRRTWATVTASLVLLTAQLAGTAARVESGGFWPAAATSPDGRHVAQGVRLDALGPVWLGLAVVLAGGFVWLHARGPLAGRPASRLTAAVAAGGSTAVAGSVGVVAAVNASWDGYVEKSDVYWLTLSSAALALLAHLGLRERLGGAAVVIAPVLVLCHGYLGAALDGRVFVVAPFALVAFVAAVIVLPWRYGPEFAFWHRPVPRWLPRG